MALILLVLGLVGTGVVVVSWWPTADGLDRGAAAERTTTATVVRSARCGSTPARDRVAVSIDGRRTRVPFNGCGHREGSRLRVLVPADPGGDFVAQPASADSVGDARGLRERLTWVLFVLAAVAGGGYSLLLRRPH